MPQPPSPHHPAAAAPLGPPAHDDDYASGYRDGLANEPAYVSAAGAAQELFPSLLDPGAVAAREERYLRGYYQGQQDRQHPDLGANPPGRPSGPR